MPEEISRDKTFFLLLLISAITSAAIRRQDDQGLCRNGVNNSVTMSNILFGGAAPSSLITSIGSRAIIAKFVLPLPDTCCIAK